MTPFPKEKYIFALYFYCIVLYNKYLFVLYYYCIVFYIPFDWVESHTASMRPFLSNAALPHASSYQTTHHWLGASQNTRLFHGEEWKCGISILKYSEILKKIKKKRRKRLGDEKRYRHSGHARDLVKANLKRYIKHPEGIQSEERKTIYMKLLLMFVVLAA